MQIELQPQPDAIKRWQELCADPDLARLPYKVETDRYGRILMSPPPAFRHTLQVGKIIKLLNTLLPEGQAVAETPVLTADGVKVTDAAWLAPGREVLEKDELVLVRAPEICIEVLSPSNSDQEMAEKRVLYFEAGAREVWICSTEGRMSFYCVELADKPSASGLCSQFPSSI